jgi:hypothetical protein
VRCGQGKILCLLHCELNFDHYLLFLWSTFFPGHTQTLIVTLSAGALIFAATNIRKKPATRAI